VPASKTMPPTKAPEEFPLDRSPGSSRFEPKPVQTSIHREPPKEMEPPSFFRGGQNPSRTQAGQPAAGAEATVYVNDSAANPPAAKQATLPRALDLQSPNPWPGVIPGYHPAADAIRWSNGCNVEAPVTPQSCPAAPVQRPRPVVQAKQETAAHVSPTVAPPYLQNRLKQQIERTCGKGIFDVEVLIRS